MSLYLAPKTKKGNQLAPSGSSGNSHTPTRIRSASVDGGHGMESPPPKSSSLPRKSFKEDRNLSSASYSSLASAFSSPREDPFSFSRELRDESELYWREFGLVVERLD